MIKTGALALIILCAYLALLTRSHYWDGVLFSLYVERVAAGEMPRAALFHPNHLVYSAAGYVLYDMFSALHLRAMTCFQIANAVCGAAAAMLLHWLALTITRSRSIALFCALIFAFGATWWKFSTDASSYVPAVFLVLLAVRGALRGRVVEAAAYHVAAMMLHQLAALAFLPIVFALTVRAGRRWAAVYSAITGAVTAGVYLAVFYGSGLDSGSGFVRWLTSFSGETKVTQTFQQVLLAYPVSYLKLFFGGKLSLVRDFPSVPVIAALTAAMGFLVVGVWLLRRPSGGNTEPIADDGLVRTTLWLWIAPYALFLAWFEPGNAFYKLFLWPPVVLLLGISISQHEWWRRRTKALLAFSFVLGAWNFGAFIYPHTEAAADPVYSLALKLNKELPAQARVFYRVFSPDDWYLAYFAPGRTWQAAPAGDLKKEAPLCLETTALDASDVNRTGLNETRRWELVDDKHHVRVACFVRRPGS